MSDELIELPWDAGRRGKAALADFFRTCWLLCTGRRGVIRRIKADGSLSSSLGFAALAAAVWVIPSAIAFHGFDDVIIRAFVAGAGIDPRRVSPGLVVALDVALTGLGVFALASVVIAWAVAGAAIDHLVLTVVRARPASFRVTLRARALSCAPAMLGIIPGCGFVVAAVLTWAMRIETYRSLHRASFGQALAGALVVPMALLALWWL